MGENDGVHTRHGEGGHGSAVRGSDPGSHRMRGLRASRGGCGAGGVSHGHCRVRLRPAGVAESMVPEPHCSPKCAATRRPVGEAAPSSPRPASAGRLKGAELDALVDALNAAGPTDPRRCGSRRPRTPRRSCGPPSATRRARRCRSAGPDRAISRATERSSPTVSPGRFRSTGRTRSAAGQLKSPARVRTGGRDRHVPELTDADWKVASARSMCDAEVTSTAPSALRRTGSGGVARIVDGGERIVVEDDVRGIDASEDESGQHRLRFGVRQRLRRATGDDHLVRRVQTGDRGGRVQSRVEDGGQQPVGVQAGTQHHDVPGGRIAGVVR